MTDNISVQYSSVDRWLVSVGALIIAADLIFAWLSLQQSGALLVSQSDIDDLSTTAQRAVADQQDLLAWVYGAWWWVVSIIALLGVGLLLFGLLRWIPLDNKLRRLNVQTAENAIADGIRDASPEEAERSRRQEEAADRSTTAWMAKWVTANPALLPEPNSTDVRPGLKNVRDAARPGWFNSTSQPNAGGSNELWVREVVASAFGETHTAQPEIALTSDGRALSVVDLVLTPVEDAHPGYAVDFKIWDQEVDFIPWELISNAASRVQRKARQASNLLRLDLRPVLLCVFASLDKIDLHQPVVEGNAIIVSSALLSDMDAASLRGLVDRAGRGLRPDHNDWGRD